MVKATDHSTDVTFDWVREYFDYDPSSGVVTWKKTPPGVYWFKPGKRAGYRKNRGYRIIIISGRGYLEHRIAWLWMTGVWPVNEIDHIDRVKNNNAWSNLRAATRQENEWNKGPLSSNTSGVLGVCSHKQSGGWQARITSRDGKPHFKLFRKIEDAIAWRKHQEVILRGALISGPPISPDEPLSSVSAKRAA